MHFRFRSLYIIFVSLCLIILLAFKLFENNIVNYYSIGYSKDIQTKITSYFKKKVEKDLENFDEFINKSKIILSSRDSDENKIEKISSLFSESEIKCYIYKNDGIFFWSEGNNYISISDLNTISIKKSLVYQNKLYINLINTDSLSIGLNKFRIICLIPYEKLFSFNNKFSEEYSFTGDIINKFGIPVFVNYFNSDLKIPDKYNRYKINSGNNFVLSVDYKLPDDDEIKSGISEKISDRIAGLTFIMIVLILLPVIYFLKKIKNKVFKFVSLSLLLAALRYLLFWLQFPAKLLPEKFSDSSFFSSMFGYGIVSNPVELFITVTFVLVLCYKLYNYSAGYIIASDRMKVLVRILSPVFLILFLTSFRGFAASVKSIIYDSKILYFQNTYLLPESPVGLMQLNILLLGLSIIFFSVSLIIFTIKPYSRNNFLLKWIILFFVFQLAALFYDSLQASPQATPAIRIIYILFVFLVVFYISVRENTIYKEVTVFLFSASFLTIVLLTFYSREHEKDYLKTIAQDFNNEDVDFVEFMLNQSVEESDKIISEGSILANNNISSAAFLLWSKSALQKENIPTSFLIYNAEKKLISSYGEQFINIDTNFFEFFEKDTLIKNPASDMMLGIKKFVAPAGHYYLVIQVKYGLKDIFTGKKPEVFSGRKPYSNTPINLEELKIFEFNRDQLINVFGDINPPLFIQNQILKTPLLEGKDGWTELNLHGDDYLTYIFDNQKRKESARVAISLKEKNLGRVLFDFFKIFFIHVFFILIAAIFFVLTHFRMIKDYFTSFRARLFFTFFIVAFIPLVLVGGYFRTLSEEKNSEAIFYKLKKRVLEVEKFINQKLKSGKMNFNEICEEAAEDLSIDYALFDKEKLVYSTGIEYFKAGIFSDLLNPKVYDQLVNKGYNEIVFNEKIENYNYKSFYYYGVIQGNYIIIKVTDLFNTFELPLSSDELDIFLFGSFSFVIIIVFMSSVLLANQISVPIRKLTKVTKAVAEGNLDIQLENKSQGEIGQLIAGFNNMLSELKRNQEELKEVERHRAWKDMARQVAHEIKNPLTPMKLAVQQLMISYEDKSPKFDSIFRKVIQMLDQQIDTIKNITNEFSNFARMPKLHYSSIDLIELLDEVKNLFIDSEIEIKINSSLKESIIESDEDQLKRTIVNLIKNSIQAYASEMVISLNKNDMIEIRLTDNGNGIDTSIIDKVFDANFTTKIEGMGLGLNMSKNFIESTGGEITVEKSSDSGTTFLIKIPANEKTN